MKILNLFGKSVVSIAVLAAFGDAGAAQNGRVGMVGAAGVVTTARMPSMPSFSLNTIGNPAVQTMDQQPEVAYKQYNNGSTVVPTPTPTPDPTPVSECPDGGIKNSTYTVSNCMNDVLQCINTGALQGGLNDMFNEDVRNSIMGGMKLCQASVDKCIHDVRVDCHNVYAQSNDVWLDFNSRIVQPEYYNFVLRKTGLTPNQAENTCLLLDRNAYGSSFSAVSDSNVVNSEYNKKVGAYNAASNGTLSKDNTQGVAVNTVGYDGNRGHYARWDAATGECLIRVAAYNKDKLITNSWLFGAVGNDKPAEIWQKAGSTFTCNKELFDFSSLLNDTKTAAVVGVGGGAVLGGAIGAAAGAGAYNKKKAALDEAEEARAASMYTDPCDDAEYRKKLGYQIRVASHKDMVLGTYLYEGVELKKDDNGKDTTEINTETGTKLFDENTDYTNLSKDQCRAIHDLYSKVELYESAMKYCDTNLSRVTNTIQVPNVVSKEDFTFKDAAGNIISGNGKLICNGLTEQEVTEYKNNCLFLPLQIGFSLDQGNIICNHGGKCVSEASIKAQVAQARALLSEIEPSVDSRIVAKSNAKEKELNKGAEIGKGIAIGAATGAGVGGIITGITALVEKNNISCKVGDGLNTVALGKAHTIDSLKDFYVKWNLHLPDTVSPTSAVTDKSSWEQACTQFNNKLADCPKVQINLKDASGKYTLVPSACKVSGNICIVNDSVMTSHGIK